MKKIMVTIDTDDEKCRNCAALGYVDLMGTDKFEDPSCGTFNEDLVKADDGIAYRCEKCMESTW